VALVNYDANLTMRDARAVYFEANGFGASGGYDDAWVSLKLGPVPVSFPNTPGRVRAVRYHDLHHVLTGYDTDNAGEFEISAFEIAAGCRDFYAAWFLNLGGTTAGLFRWPRRTFRAFLRGRASQSLYGQPLEPLLDATVSEARARMRCPDEPPPARASDVALFGLTVLAGFATGLPLLALAVPAAPQVLAGSYLVRRMRRSAPA
jgi:hypothetical protein